MTTERMMILEMVEAGRITTLDALRLLSAMGADEDALHRVTLELDEDLLDVSRLARPAEPETARTERV